MNTRIVVGEGSCGLAAGAGAVYQALAEAIGSADVSLGITGCVGLCYLEPIVDVYMNGQLLRCVRVKPEDAARIAGAALQGDAAGL